MTNSVNTRMNIICSKGFCNQNRYYLVGNEPEISKQDLCGDSSDPVQDAVNCYGVIAKAVRTKDPTAKLIMLGLGSDNATFIRSYIQKWKTTWAGTTEIADLSQVASGWHFHDYGGYNRCPTDDSRARNLKLAVDQEMQARFGRVINNQEIWVTEMGSLSPPNQSNFVERQKFLNLMECLVNIYEASPIVNRYAWFYTGDLTQDWPLTSLYTSSASGGYNITDLGLKYGLLPPGPSPSPTPLPENCQTFGQSIVDQKQENKWRYQTINSGWGYGGPLTFQPQIMGKLDKVELYVAGSGKVQVKIVNQSGVDISDTIEKNIASEGWLEFDFITEEVIIPGNLYTILFRDSGSSNDVRPYRGDSWNWAYRQYVKPCQSGAITPSPTTSPTPSNQQQPSPTPTAPVSGNHSPVITVSGYLPQGQAGQDYKPSGRIFYVEGYDEDVNDDLSMKYYGPPSGISLGQCTQTVVNNKKIIKCPVVAANQNIPSSAARDLYYYGRIILTDSNGAKTEKNVAIKIVN